MIDYKDVSDLGFKRVTEKDSVYEDQFGRPYYYMEYLATIEAKGVRNEITFNWDCDVRSVCMFKNDTDHLATFTELEDFMNVFVLFTNR